MVNLCYNLVRNQMNIKMGKVMIWMPILITILAHAFVAYFVIFGPTKFSEQPENIVMFPSQNAGD